MRIAMVIHIEENQTFEGTIETIGETVTDSVNTAIEETVGAVGLAANAADRSMDAADGATLQAAERVSIEVAETGMREATNIDSTLGGYGQH